MEAQAARWIPTRRRWRHALESRRVLAPLLIAPAVVMLSYGDGANSVLRYGIALIALAIAVGAVVLASRRSHQGGIASEADAAAADSGDDSPGAAVEAEAEGVSAKATK